MAGRHTVDDTVGLPSCPMPSPASHRIFLIHRECTGQKSVSPPSFFAIILSSSCLTLMRPSLWSVFPVTSSGKPCMRRGYSMNEHPIKSHYPEFSQDQVLQFKISLQQEWPSQVSPAPDGAPTSTTTSGTPPRCSTLPLSTGVEGDFPGSRASCMTGLLTPQEPLQGPGRCPRNVFTYKIGKRNIVIHFSPLHEFPFHTPLSHFGKRPYLQQRAGQCSLYLLPRTAARGAPHCSRDAAIPLCRPTKSPTGSRGTGTILGVLQPTAEDHTVPALDELLPCYVLIHLSVDVCPYNNSPWAFLDNQEKASENQTMSKHILFASAKNMVQI